MLAVPMTVSPDARAICVAAMPTPPLAPWMNSVSPELNARAIVQGAKCSHIGHADAGALREAQSDRAADELVRLAEHFRGIGAVALVGDRAGRRRRARPLEHRATPAPTLRRRPRHRRRAYRAAAVGSRSCRSACRCHTDSHRLHEPAPGPVRPGCGSGTLEASVLQGRQTHERGSPSRGRCY